MEKGQRKTQGEITEYVNSGSQEWRAELCEGFGDALEHKSEEVIRIGFQNVNGVKGRMDMAHEIFDVISDKELDIFGVAETNMNWTDRRRQEALAAVKLRFGQGQIVGSSGQSAKEGYLPGGTAIVARGQVT